MRSFRVIQPRSSSIFHSASPAGAAKKVCTRNKSKNCVVEVEDVKSGKRYSYRVRKIYDPVTVERDGVEVTYDYRLEAKSLGGSRKSKSRKSRSRKSKSRSSSRKSKSKSRSRKSKSRKVRKSKSRKSKSRKSGRKSRSRSRR